MQPPYEKAPPLDGAPPLGHPNPELLSVPKTKKESNCESCDDLNTSCPEGCERDPVTGELCYPRGSTTPLLDHGFVRLVDFMGSDLSVVRAARVSYDAAWRAGEDEGSDTRLINYLWENHHSTPFEAVTFTFEIKAPIFVFRQWHRHRTWSYNEMSARYCVLPEEYYVPELENICYQSKDNKQGRSGPMPEDEARQIQEWIENQSREAFDQYHDLLATGVSKEIARSVLPVGTYSHMFATVNLLNLLKFVRLRSDPHAQYEIRVFSDAMVELAKKVAPVSLAAFEEFG